MIEKIRNKLITRMFEYQTELDGDVVKVEGVALLIRYSEVKSFQVFIGDVNVVGIQWSGSVGNDPAQLLVYDDLPDD